MNRSKPEEGKNIVNISILLTLTLCLGIYLIMTSAVIAQDGVTFIEYAKALDNAFTETVRQQYQHPGYPLLILTTYKILQYIGAPASVLTWIYSGQSVALLFRMLAVTMLYFVGRKLVGPRMSFWAVLIFILLPLPAKYGSDALSDWPNMFFLSAGFLLLLDGAKTGKWFPFGCAGFVAGAGYLIRPECAQLVVFGVLWLLIHFLRAERIISRGRIMVAMGVLLAGFLISAGPYMAAKGAIFPKKDVGRFAANVKQNQPSRKSEAPAPNVAEEYKRDFSPANIAAAIVKLADNEGRTFMWFFVPALLIGLCKSLKKRKWYEPEKFFIVTLITLNIFLMIWLYCKYDYMSARHSMALSIFTAFSVPVGLEVLAQWIENQFGKSSTQPALADKGCRFWFLTLIVIGISICIPKLLRPIRAEKHAHRSIADWLKTNSNPEDTVAVPDKRISFYAERQGLIYNNGKIPTNAVYVVKIFGRKDDPVLSPQESAKTEYRYINKKDGKVRAVIYRNF